ncbi:MAG TPA: pyruvate formate-lyase 1-activating enzyme, partial [Actinotalea sp.]|nr:pyruvate formate-lyase 1-activating enzyme [Actinotalea sp.]
QMGRDKWEALGLDYQLDGVAAPTTELVQRVRDQFRERGLTVY